MTLDGAQLRQTMRAFATGVTVVLTPLGDDVHGMTANAVCSVSLDPPLMMVSVDNRSRMNAALVEGAAFSINVLDARQSPIADRFARRWTWSSEAAEFEYVGEAPVLPGSLASLVCTVDSRIPAGDHTMVMGLVQDARHAGGLPLLFFDGKWMSLPGPEDVFLLDRSAFRSEMHAQLDIDLESTALVAIDMTRGHLDPEVATMPCPPAAAAALIERAGVVYQAMRERGCPIIHVTLQFSRESIGQNPYVRAVDAADSGLIPWLKTRISDHNPTGSAQAQIVDELAPLRGEVLLADKRRPSAFFGTSLDRILEERGIDTLVLAGINTNTSILHTAFDAFCRDMKVIVLEDCTISMYGPDLHELALKNIDYSLGWVMSWEDLLLRLGGGPDG